MTITITNTAVHLSVYSWYLTNSL